MPDITPPRRRGIDPPVTIALTPGTGDPPAGPMTAEHPDPTAQPLPIAIVGAGFRGTIAALHLLDPLPDPLPARTLLLSERAPSLGRGVACATDDPVHLPNVRAANMSAYPDAPEH